MQQVLKKVYDDDTDAAAVCELLVDLDEGMQEWRYHHVKMVERTIGGRSGTGGSAGATYLSSTIGKPTFPDLWAVAEHWVRGLTPGIRARARRWTGTVHGRLGQDGSGKIGPSLDGGQLDPVPALPLGDVQRGVGEPLEPLQRARVVGEAGDADGDRDRHVGARQGDSAIVARTRSAISRAAAISVSGSRTANSSPPLRPAKSRSRTTLRSAAPTLARPGPPRHARAGR